MEIGKLRSSRKVGKPGSSPQVVNVASYSEIINAGSIYLLFYQFPILLAAYFRLLGTCIDQIVPRIHVQRDLTQLHSIYHKIWILISWSSRSKSEILHYTSLMLDARASISSAVFSAVKKQIHDVYMVICWNTSSATWIEFQIQTATLRLRSIISHMYQISFHSMCTNKLYQWRLNVGTFCLW